MPEANVACHPGSGGRSTRTSMSSPGDAHDPGLTPEKDGTGQRITASSVAPNISDDRASKSPGIQNEGNEGFPFSGISAPESIPGAAAIQSEGQDNGDDDSNNHQTNGNPSAELGTTTNSDRQPPAGQGLSMYMAPQPSVQIRGVQETAGTSILSVGTAAQIRAQRNRFITELTDLIESDSEAYKQNVADVLDMLRSEATADRTRQGDNVAFHGSAI